MKILITILAVATLAGCTTGEKFAQLRPGTTKAQVISLLGNPKGYAQSGSTEIFQYPGGLVSGWSNDIADFSVTLHNGLVTSYGASNVQKGADPAVLLLATPAYPAIY